MTPWPIDEPANWLALLQERLPQQELAQIRQSVKRGRPFGDERWVIATARRLWLTHTLRGVGRPPKQERMRN